MAIITQSCKYPPREAFRGLIVRPILPEEIALWDHLMKTHHYLGFDSLIGESIRYVAILENCWVALIGWASGALCCSAREQWLSWDQQIKEQRLSLIANNVRFLILPGVKLHNLASKILSLNVKRLSIDWENIHGHSILLAETFVDPSRFLGTCYKAAGWICVGNTKGFRKSAKKYIYHGNIKTVWLRPLHKYSREWLRTIKLPKHVRLKKMVNFKLTKKQQESLQSHLRKLPDYRQPKGLRHPMRAVISMSICAILCGATSYDAIAQWCSLRTQNQLKRFGAYYNHKNKCFVAPSEPTIRRVLQNADVESIDKALNTWIFNALDPEAQKDNIAIDGKVLRGAKKNNGKQVNLLSAFLHKQGVVIGQIEIDDKTNEIPEIKTLLNPMDVEGKIITADALHTQKETANYVVNEKKADFVFTVKDNQPTLKADIEALNLERFPPPEAETIDKGHGRIEIRRIWTSTKLNDYLQFPYVQQVFIIEREVTKCKTGETYIEKVAGITSLIPSKAKPAILLSLNRGHWSIENSLHYVRDVTFGEDHSQVRTNKGPRMMASLRNFAISLLRIFGKVKNIAKARRFLCNQQHLALQLLGV